MLKLLQYCNYIIIVMQIKLMLLLLLLLLLVDSRRAALTVSGWPRGEWGREVDTTVSAKKWCPVEALTKR